MNNGPLSTPFASLSQTLSRALLRYGQTPAWVHRSVLAAWPLGLGALLLILWIAPTQDRIHTLEAQIRARTIEIRRLDEHLREAEVLTRDLQALAPLSAAALTSPRPTHAPWLFLQGLAEARSVHLLDYTPLHAKPEPDCQRLRLKTNGATLAVQALLQDLLRSPHAVERFTLSPSTPPDARGSIHLSLQLCVRETQSQPSAYSPPASHPSAALFQPAPKVALKPRTALEELPLSAYRVIATGRAAHDHYALVRTPAGKIHTVRPGMRIGDRSAQVHAILPNGIEVQQDTDRQSLLIGNPP